MILIHLTNKISLTLSNIWKRLNIESVNPYAIIYKTLNLNINEYGSFSYED